MKVWHYLSTCGSVVVSVILLRLLQRPFPPPPPGNKGVVVVTGASTGIGRHAAEYLSSAGFTVLAGVRREDDLKALLNPTLPFLHPVLLDVTQDVDIQAVADKAVGTELPIWGLVNNAGVGYPMPVELVDLGRAREVFEVNTFSIIAMTRVFAPLMRKAGGGRIVNVGSATGTLAVQGDGIYSASKHAVEGLSDSMRLELSRWDISVSLVIPGQVKSAMWEKMARSLAPALQDLSTEQYDLYRHLFQQVERSILNFLPGLASPAVTSVAIAHALMGRHPKTRYVVAGISRVPLWVIRYVARLLPDRLLDAAKLNL